MEQAYVIDKNTGETPLEALERFRASDKRFTGLSMTYAGRLDPMASGKLIILVGEKCKDKDDYLALDKEYEVEILFGMTSDTHDILGMPKDGKLKNVTDSSIDWTKYVGKFKQEYPAYSSKTVNGIQLHNLARSDELPEEMPTKDVEVYSVVEIGGRSIFAKDLFDYIITNVKKVQGDFRQEEIMGGWNSLLSQSEDVFQIIKIKVHCSSGTYMRSLAHKIGEDMGTGAIALSIHRTKIFGI